MLRPSIHGAEEMNETGTKLLDRFSRPGSGLQGSRGEELTQIGRHLRFVLRFLTNRKLNRGRNFNSWSTKRTYKDVLLI